MDMTPDRVPLGVESPLRRRVYEILDHGGAAADRTASIIHKIIIGLILANIAAVILETEPSLQATWGPLFTAIEIISVLAFTVEYLLRAWAAVEHAPLAHLSPWRARLTYLRGPSAIVDLLAVLPFYLAFFVPVDLRVFLVFRLLRYFKIARYSPGMASLIEAVVSERRALLACLVILFGNVLVCATAMHLAEHTAQPEKFGSIPLAMYWAVITLTTVGYGDAVPVTPLGKIIAGLTAITGLVMLALPVGIVASAFAREIHRRDFVVTWGMVARVPLFAGLNAVAIADIMRCLKSQLAETGDVITRRGDEAHCMFFIASGEVEIELPRERVRLGEGHFFGEIAVLARTNRTATVRALTRTRLLILDKEDLHAVMDAEPRVADMIAAVARERVAREQLDPEGDIASEELLDATRSPSDEPVLPLDSGSNKKGAA
jgi:voltage-gated potassium channel